MLVNLTCCINMWSTVFFVQPTLFTHVHHHPIQTKHTHTHVWWINPLSVQWRITVITKISKLEGAKLCMPEKGVSWEVPFKIRLDYRLFLHLPMLRQGDPLVRPLLRMIMMMVPSLSSTFALPFPLLALEIALRLLLHYRRPFHLPPLVPVLITSLLWSMVGCRYQVC